MTKASLAIPSAPATGALATTLRRFVHETVPSRFRRWLGFNAAYRELMALDDRLLADIGLRRGDVERLFRNEPAAEASSLRPHRHALPPG